MLDRSRLGRAELQKQSHEDVVLRIMPVIAEGLAMRHAPDLQVGCYMILTILSAKTQLSEDVLTGMMDRVVSRWENATHAGLICLVALAQKRQAVRLPAKTFKALASIEHLSEDLALLKKHYKVEKLTLGMVLGLLKRLSKAGSAERLRLIQFLLEANLMPSNLVAVALNSMLRLSKGIDPLPQPKDGFDVHSALVDLVLYVADTSTVGPTFRHALKEVDAEIQQYGNSLLGNHGALELVPVQQDEDEEMQDVDDTPQATRFEELTSQIPTRTAFEVSLLSHSDSYIFKSLSDAFLSACQSPKNLHSFSELPVLRKSLAMTEPLYISFFVRIWCGNYPVSARVAAITALSNYFKGERLVADVQVLLPYVIHALGDASPMLRRAATELLVTLADAYRAIVDNADGSPVTLPVLGKGQIYGRESDEQDKAWLSQEITVKLIRDWLVPHVEEFRLGPDQIGRCLIDHIEAGTESTILGKRTSKFKSSFRSTVLSWLCSHVVNTPLYSVKDRLLPLLTSIAKAGQTSTVTLLAPLLKATFAQGSTTIQEKCEKEHLDTSQYVDHVMEIAKPNDRETLKLLEDYMIDPTATIHGLLYLAIFRRLRTLWRQLPAQHQVSLARAMLDLALLDPDSRDIKIQQQEAADTLRDAKFSCETLNMLLQDRPSLVKNASERASKRRRTTTISHARGDEVKRTSIILEAIESSVSKGHLPLLSGLFEVVTDLQSYKESTGTELHYLELMAMGSILTILESSPVCWSLILLCVAPRR